MTAFACLLLAIALGIAAMGRLYRCLAKLGPRWAVIALLSGAGAAFGIGATSILFVVADVLAPRFASVELVAETGALAWMIYSCVRRLKPDPDTPPPHRPSNLVAAAALILVLILATGAMSKAWDLNPQGGWDAWSIWNLRAKFLVHPDTRARAWSPLLKETHPEYPLLLSGAVARCWRWSDGAPESVPIAIGYLLFLSLIAAVTGGIAVARGSLAGLAAGLTLASSGALLHEVPSQYADIPIAAYLACSMVFVLIDRPIWAGVFAGFAAWTKDEGALFCVVMLMLLAIGSLSRRGLPAPSTSRREAPRVMLGMLPGAMAFGAFKFFLAPHVTAQFGAGGLSRFANPGRWGVVLGGVLSQIVSFGAGWFHPIFIVAALAIGVRLRAYSKNGSRRDAYFATALAAAMLAGYCVAMVSSSNDALWQTNTAAGRLVVQWWPLAVIAMMMWLRPAGEWSVPEASAKRKRV